MTFTALQSAIWTLLLLTAGRHDYVPFRGTFDVFSEDGRTVSTARAAVVLTPAGRCVMYFHVDKDGRDDTSDATRLHELAHLVDCLDNRALDGSPLPLDADLSIIPNKPGCHRNAAERFACWYVANVDRAAAPAQADHWPQDP